MWVTERVGEKGIFGEVREMVVAASWWWCCCCDGVAVVEKE